MCLINLSLDNKYLNLCILFICDDCEILQLIIVYLLQLLQVIINNGNKQLIRLEIVLLYFYQMMFPELYLRENKNEFMIYFTFYRKTLFQF